MNCWIFFSLLLTIGIACTPATQNKTDAMDTFLQPNWGEGLISEISH